MSQKVGINGLGRIGRALWRLAAEEKGVDIVAINSRSSIEMAAHLLQYDSVHGTYKKSISIKDSVIQSEGVKTSYSSYSHPSKIPWSKWGVDWVLECSGVFKKRQDLEGHLKAGAKKVFVANPLEEADFTVIQGVNQNLYKAEEHKILSNGSCTTNCLAPLVKVLEPFGIESLFFTTIHSYTQDQKLLDSSHKKDLRRARAAALSMVPTNTGASKVLTQVFPLLKGQVRAMAVRVPTANVSLVDVTIHLKTRMSKEQVNSAFLSEACGQLKGVLACEEKELVSVDFNGNLHSSIVDLPSTMVIKGPTHSLVKILAWYDNEQAFSRRMLDFVLEQKHLEQKHLEQKHLEQKK